MTRFIPETTPNGGTVFGNSYVSLFASCPRAWFNSYLRPTGDPDNETGVRPRFTKSALLVGRLFHEGMAALYLSGCRDGQDTGEWQIDEAIAVMHGHWNKALPEYESQDDADLDWNGKPPPRSKMGLEEMLRMYYDEVGPHAENPDYPNIQVVHDGNGEPLIERELALDLNYKGYVYTCRPDLIITQAGYLKVMEHKTSASKMWANERLEAFHTDSQITGEIFVLRALFPDEKIEGVLGNVIVKSPGPKTPFVMRETGRRRDLDLEHFRLATIDVLKEIDRRVQGFQDDVDGEMLLETAAARWFPDHGTRTGQCNKYRGCFFLSLCANKGREEQILGDYVPRTKVEVQATQSQP